MLLMMDNIMNDVTKMVDAYTTESARISKTRRTGMTQPCLSVSERDFRAKPKLNQTTPHPATIPEQTVNSRCVTRQMAGANCMYAFMANQAIMAHVTKEMMPDDSACW